VSIILQSTVVGFSAEFIRRLPEFEQAMVAHGLELSQFVISKDRATPTTLPAIGPFYEYTVFAGDEIFTVTQPDDIKFLEYFTSTASRRTQPRRRRKADEGSA